jgi:hypothetical protein
MMAELEDLIREARQVDLETTEGRFRLGDLADELDRALPGAPDLLGRLAIDLKVDRDVVADAWHVATAFPPDTRRPGLPWTLYAILRFHPDRHELVDLAAQNGWTQAEVERELSARFAAHYLTREAG